MDIKIHCKSETEIKGGGGGYLPGISQLLLDMNYLCHWQLFGQINLKSIFFLSYKVHGAWCLLDFYIVI